MNSLKLIPEPKEVLLTGQKLKLKKPVTKKLLMNLENSFNKFPQQAEKDLKSFGVNIRFFEVANLEEQAYKIEITETGIVIYAKDQLGLKYGFSTLIQLLEINPKALPCCTINDEPANKFRSFHLDLRIHKFKPEYILEIIKKIAKLKYRYLVLEYDNCFPYVDAVELTGELHYTVKHIAEFKQCAENCGLEIIPYLSIASKTNNILSLEANRKLKLRIDERISPGGIDILNLADADAADIISYQLTQLAEKHQAKNLFIDLSAYDYWGQSLGCKYLATVDFKENLSKIFAILSKKGIRPIIWSDLLLDQPKMVEEIIKNPIIIARENHSPFEYKEIEALAEKNGLEVVNEISTLNHLDQEFTRDTNRMVKSALAKADIGQLNGAFVSCKTSMGNCNSYYEIGGNAVAAGMRKMHIDTLWYAISFIGELAWNPSECSVLVFSEKWPRFWFGNDDKRLVEIQYLMSSNLTFKDQEGLDSRLNEYKQLIKLKGKLKPVKACQELDLLVLYAEFATLSVKMKKLFLTKPTAKKCESLNKQIEKVKIKHKAILRKTLFRKEIKDEQQYFFKYIEDQITRYNRKL